MQRIGGNEVTEAAAAGRDGPPFLSSGKVRTSYQRKRCRGMFPTWKLMWKAGTPVSLRFVLHSNPVILCQPFFHLQQHL